MSAPSRSASCLTASLREPFEFEAPVNSPEFSLSASSARPLPPAPPRFAEQNPHRSSHPASPARSANASPPSSRNYFPVLRNRIPFAVLLPLILSFSLFSFYLSTNPYAHPSPLYSSSLRFPFRTQLYTSPRRYRFHVRSVSVPFKSSDRSRLSYPTENRKSSRPLFPPGEHTRAYTRIQSTRLCPPLFPSSYFSPLRCSTVRSIATSTHCHFVSLFLNRAPPRSFRLLFFIFSNVARESTVSFLSHVHLGIFPSLPFRTFSGVVFLRECARVACISVFVKLDVARHQVRCFVRKAFEDLAGFAVGIEIKPTGFHD